VRVLFATPLYSPYIGGVQRCVEEVARRLVRLGADVTVVSADPTHSLPAHEVLDGVSVRRVRSWPQRRDYQFAPGVVPVVADGNWDVVHVQSFHTCVAPLAMSATLRAGLPYVLTFHGGGHSSQLRNVLRGAQIKALRPLLRRADRLVATARFEIGSFGRQLDLPRSRFALIPNGSDLAEPPPVPVAGDQTTIASVGRLERYKGHHRIIAALPHIAARRPDVRLRIVGTGSYEPQLKRLAARLGVSDLVTIEAVPSGERAEMTALLGDASLVVLLSEYETHPMAALEAASMGRPLLLADTSGLRELAEAGIGRAVPLTSDPGAVAAAALEELDAPSTRPPVALPSWDACAEQHLELYEDVLARRR
jgi:glycogen synthase